MKYVVCPPCGTVFKGETEEDVIEATRAHAQEKHEYAIPRDEVLRAMTTTPPPSSKP